MFVPHKISTSQKNAYLEFLKKNEISMNMLYYLQTSRDSLLQVVENVLFVVEKIRKVEDSDKGSLLTFIYNCFPAEFIHVKEVQEDFIFRKRRLKFGLTGEVDSLAHGDELRKFYDRALDLTICRLLDTESFFKDLYPLRYKLAPILRDSFGVNAPFGMPDFLGASIRFLESTSITLQGLACEDEDGILFEEKLLEDLFMCLGICGFYSPERSQDIMKNAIFRLNLHRRHACYNKISRKLKQLFPDVFNEVKLLIKQYYIENKDICRFPAQEEAFPVVFSCAISHPFSFSEFYILRAQLDGNHLLKTRFLEEVGELPKDIVFWELMHRLSASHTYEKPSYNCLQLLGCLCKRNLQYAEAAISLVSKPLVASVFSILQDMKMCEGGNQPRYSDNFKNNVIATSSLLHIIKKLFSIVGNIEEDVILKGCISPVFLLKKELGVCLARECDSPVQLFEISSSSIVTLEEDCRKDDMPIESFYEHLNISNSTIVQACWSELVACLHRLKSLKQKHLASMLPEYTSYGELMTSLVFALQQLHGWSKSLQLSLPEFPFAMDSLKTKNSRILLMKFLEDIIVDLRGADYWTIIKGTALQKTEERFQNDELLLLCGVWVFRMLDFVPRHQLKREYEKVLNILVKYSNVSSESFSHEISMRAHKIGEEQKVLETRVNVSLKYFSALEISLGMCQRFDTYVLKTFLLSRILCSSADAFTCSRFFVWFLYNLKCWNSLIPCIKPILMRLKDASNLESKYVATFIGDVFFQLYALQLVSWGKSMQSEIFAVCHQLRIEIVTIVSYLSDTTNDNISSFLGSFLEAFPMYSRIYSSLLEIINSNGDTKAFSNEAYLVLSNELKQRCKRKASFHELEKKNAIIALRGSIFSKQKVRGAALTPEKAATRG